jgi:WD40 repeat protein
MTLTGHNAPVLTVIFSFDSKKIASSDQNGEIIIWSMPEGKMIRRIKGHTELVQDVSFADDNIRLVSGSLDKTIKLWDTDTGNLLFSFDTGNEVWSVDLVADASIITFGCEDGTVRMLIRQQEKAPKKPVKGGKK